MVLKLNPDIPAVWLSPQTLRFGFDEPLLVLEELNTGEEQLVSLLQHGTTAGAYRMFATRMGVSADNANTLLEALQPLFLPPQPPPPVTYRLIGEPALIDSLSTLLLKEQPETQARPSVRKPQPELPLTISISRFLAFSSLGQETLSNNTAHLPIVLGDQSVWVGPVILPGIVPCLYCIERAEVSREPHLATMIVQLLEPRTQASDPALLRFAAALTAERISTFRLGEASNVACRIKLNGQQQFTEYEFSPECLCSRATELGTEKAS